MYIENTIKVGQLFISNAYMTTASPVTLIGTNTNGLIIRTLQANNNQAGSSLVFYADTAPPSATWDPTKRPFLGLQEGQVYPLAMPYPLLIPAGYFVYAAYTGSTGICVIMTYDLVTG